MTLGVLQGNVSGIPPDSPVDVVSDDFQIKHHFGNNAANFADPLIGQYNDAALILSFHSAGQ